MKDKMLDLNSDWLEASDFLRRVGKHITNAANYMGWIDELYFAHIIVSDARGAVINDRSERILS